MGRTKRNLYAGMVALGLAVGPLAAWYVGDGLAMLAGCDSYGDSGAVCPNAPLLEVPLSAFALLPWLAMITLVPGLLIAAVLLTSVPMTVVDDGMRRRKQRKNRQLQDAIVQSSGFDEEEGYPWGEEE